MDGALVAVSTVPTCWCHEHHSPRCPSSFLPWSDKGAHCWACSLCRTHATPRRGHLMHLRPPRSVRTRACAPACSQASGFGGGLGGLDDLGGASQLDGYLGLGFNEVQFLDAATDGFDMPATQDK